MSPPAEPGVYLFLINFEKTTFGFTCKTVFRGTEPGQVFLEGTVNFKNVLISEYGEEYEKRKGILVFEWVNLGQTEFLNTDISKIKFRDATWDNQYDLFMFGGWRSRLHDEKKWRNERAKQKGQEVDNKYLTQLSLLYRELKKHYLESGEIHLVGHFHYGVMNVLLRQKENEQLKQFSGLRQKIKKFFSCFWLNLYKYSSGFGEDYALAGTWVLALLIVFGVIYFVCGVPKENSNPSALVQLANSLFYSFQAGTLSRVAFYKEMNIGLSARFFHLLESILVPAQFAFFVIALRNRFRR
ncbi:MAG: hypothetical protein HY889_00785 [Deltaproteobacteria bacterium]|nr:hypothetical protein [Deltaproteobacteria bacterium]